MRFSIFGRRRPSAGGAGATGVGLATMRISSGLRTPSRSLGRRDVAFSFQRLFLPSAVLDTTLLFLRQAGVRGDERFLVWAGSILAGEGVVSTVVMPHAASGPLHGEIPPE